MKKLLVVVDYQQDFVDGALGFAGAERLEGPLCRAAEQTLAEGGYVVFTRDTHGPGYLQSREGLHLPVEHCVKGTPGHRLYGALHGFEEAPRPGTLLLDKPTFGSPTLARRAEELCGGPPEVVELCGVVTDICVLANAVLLHTAFPLASVRVLKGLCGSGNGANAAKALDLLAAMGIAVVE